MSNKTKGKVQNQKNVENQADIAAYKAAGIRHGIEGQEIDEAVPTLNKAPSEKVIGGVNNSYIIFGRDRPNIRMSGYGGKGGTQCAKIDLIAGMASSMTKHGPPDSTVAVSPNFVLDASRIYMSQRCDIDAYMGLAESPGDKSKARSAIALKSDCIRLHARNNIKIVTGKSRYGGLGKDGELNSSGGKDEIPGTISFIAGNYTERELRQEASFFNPFKKMGRGREKLQPLVKGENLVEFLEEIMGSVDAVLQQVAENTLLITQLGYSYAGHTHLLPMIPPIPIPPSPDGAPVGIRVGKRGVEITGTHIPNLFTKSRFTRQNFLKVTSPVYINSRHVYTT